MAKIQKFTINNIYKDLDIVRNKSGTSDKTQF